MPEAPMDGKVGYDDVLLVLEQLNWAEQGWQQCRSRLLGEGMLLTTSSFRSAGEYDLIKLWLLDKCPKFPSSAYSRFFWELDSWTEYWDLYHPETKGRYYFGDETNSGLLSEFLPSPTRRHNPVFEAWKRL